MLWKGKHVLLHMWHPYFPLVTNPVISQNENNEFDCDYDKLNITLVICEKDIPLQLTSA
jgi:hypothetical protein